MDFRYSRRQSRSDNVVPMINVVFLLLIFFMISSELTPPPPFDVAPPEAAFAAMEDGEITIFVAADGEVAWEEHRGDDVLTALARAPDGVAVTLRADGSVPAQVVARLLRQITDLGFADLSLATAPSSR